MTDTVTVIFQPMNRLANVPAGSTVLAAIREAGVRFESICGGKGECGKCRVIHVRGSCETVPSEGSRGISPAELLGGYRLACMTTVTGNCEFIIPVESRIDSPQILLDTVATAGDPEPSVSKYLTESGGSLQFPLQRSLRLTGYSGQRPRMTREQHDLLTSGVSPHTVTISTSAGYPEIIGVDEGDTLAENFGVAIDLGTTTIAGALFDLADGKLLARGSSLNRQITYGEELITRIAVAGTPEGKTRLRNAAIESINTVISHLAEEAGIGTQRINDLCIAGNTVMVYLLAGMDPSILEQVDAAVSRSPVVLGAGELGLTAAFGAHVYCLPNVSRFVGGDAVGDVVVSRMHRSPDYSLMIDLGTNGELVFGNSEWLVSASCASGPAFEGAGISSGMRAMKGAIEHVRIDPRTGVVTFRTIGDGRPVGICGSGIIDAASAMVSAGIIDFTGRIVPAQPGVRDGPDGPEYVLVPAARTATGRDIVITGADMAYLMDSKAAACGAIGVLMKKYRIRTSDVRHVYLAGAFGEYTDMRAVTAFGIIPDFFNAEYHHMGNGSLAGACMALLSRKRRTEAEEIARKMVYIDLLVESDFIEEYSAALYIPGKEEYFCR